METSPPRASVEPGGLLLPWLAIPAQAPAAAAQHRLDLEAGWRPYVDSNHHSCTCREEMESVRAPPLAHCLQTAGNQLANTD